jgi:competence protein ComEA
VVAVLVVGLGWALWSLVHARPEPVPDAQPAAGIVSGSPVVQPSGQPTPGSTPSASSQVLVVDVEGKVRRPGLARVKAGARVADVLSAAGGALPGVDLTGLNLARQVADGEQILVGVPGGAPVGTPTGPVSPGGPSAGGQVDLNTATVAQLEDLPGVGPVLAQRIIDWRTEHGRFTSVDELQEVSGVGEKKFASLKPHVRV